MTIFAPAARHFLVQASPPALAPLAPHLSSLIHPLTVALFPMSSNAIADRASTKVIAIKSATTFLMAVGSSFSKCSCRLIGEARCRSTVASPAAAAQPREKLTAGQVGALIR